MSLMSKYDKNSEKKYPKWLVTIGGIKWCESHCFIARSTKMALNHHKLTYLKIVQNRFGNISPLCANTT